MSSLAPCLRSMPAISCLIASGSGDRRISNSAGHHHQCVDVNQGRPLVRVSSGLLTRNGEPAREPGRQKRRRLPPLCWVALDSAWSWNEAKRERRLLPCWIDQLCVTTAISQSVPCGAPTTCAELRGPWARSRAFRRGQA
jgi:hypothetical protein